MRAMQQLQFDEMALYARVAELGSLSAVARERDVPVSQVSRTLARLEKACGARLMHRSTHGLSLTDEGRTFLAYSRRALDTLEELEGAFAASSGEPSGVVRVAASSLVAQYRLVPSLAGLAAQHPRLQLEFEVGDRLVDMVREGIDISIRTVNNLPDNVVARRIGAFGRALYAAPGYAAARGQWRANDSGMAAQMVLEGLGIGRLNTWVGEALVAQGLLVPVLAAFIDPQPVPVYAVTAPTRHRLPKIKACLDYWEAWFAR
jgi:DNA-binding transcriptional LysR family regulator